MKHSFWLGLVMMGAALLAAGPTRAQTQSLAGVWQGVETDANEPNTTWPSVLRVQRSTGNAVFGVLYQEATGRPGVTATFQMEGTRTAAGMRLQHVRKLNETGQTPFSFWCYGAITFTYDPAQEKLTGRAAYRPEGECDVGSFTFYRIRLKSAAKVAAGVESTLRVSGRNVLWYADADRKQPVATGNTYRTKLNKTTTFYLTQGYYPTRQSTAVPITIQVSGAVPKPAPTPPAPADTARPAPAPLPAPTPVVLPTVLFRQGTPELLPEGLPALDQLAAALKARPGLKLRVAGHTDKIGEPEKNQALSEQRAEAVKTYLVKAGVAAERISATGYGDSRPLHASPDARNRRVEVEEIK